MDKDNIWLLTEERPKCEVVYKILTKYCEDFCDEIEGSSDELKIKPIVENNTFKFVYLVEGVSVKGIDKIWIKTVKGTSSFVDFLLFKQKNSPEEDENATPLMAIEETKTRDFESRNTSVYQRGTKFVYIRQYYKDVKLYMLYNDENEDSDRKPTATCIFGTRIFQTLGVTILGRTLDPEQYKKFSDIDELISEKNKIRAHNGNIPILITKSPKSISVSGRLSKPAKEGNIGHDPNIGALSMISAALRTLGWKEEIIITGHKVKTDRIAHSRKTNKFLNICKDLKISLDGVEIPEGIHHHRHYWEYEKKSEKVASILLHVMCDYLGTHTVYENHAGCERGYFYKKDMGKLTLPKTIGGKNLCLPDLVLYDRKSNCVLIVEGKQSSTLKKGIAELKNYNDIETQYIEKQYSHSNILRGLSIFGAEWKDLPDKNVLFYLSETGKIILKDAIPDFVKDALKAVSV